MIRHFLTASVITLVASGACNAETGKDIYAKHCTACHQADGAGLPGTFPPLKGNAALKDLDFTISVLLNGLNAKIEVNGKTYHGQMPDWSSQLNDQQVADVLSYIRNTFNDFGDVTVADVKKAAASGQKPADLMPKTDATVGKPAEGAASQPPSDVAKPSASAPESGQSAATLGDAEMDSKALTAAMKSIKYNPPFPATLEDETGEFAEMAKLGYLIFTDTQNYAPDYTKNGLNCSNCHIQAGAQANSAPLWGAFPNYPTFRSKNNLVNSFENRLQGCFLYSMNGIAPPASGEVLEALSAYAAWMSEGLPLGVSVDGRGYPSVKDFKDPDTSRGASLFEAKCAICHGKTGQGTKISGGGRGYQFPPLWGPDSYNWGAGMHSEKNFRNFISANMPLGQGGSLSDQDAADIAAYVNQPAHTRPTRIHNPGQAPDF